MKKVLLVVGFLVAGFVAYHLYGNSVGPVAQGADNSLTIREQINYTISIQAVPIDAHVVLLKVATDIPLPVKVAASISAKGQAPTDTYIGVDKFVILTSPEQTIELDGSSEKLPSGEYTAEVAFHPRWGAENSPEQAKAIKQKIVGVVDVTLGGSGKSKAQADQRNISQKWVMENEPIGTAWNESQFSQKMGPFEKSAATLNLHDTYYFPETDMTIIVSRVNKKVATWRWGRPPQ